LQKPGNDLPFIFKPKLNHMKKWIIGALVGAIIMFVWQAASWMFLNLHKDAGKYHPAQDSVVSYLSSVITEDGAYMMPTGKPGSSMKDHQEMMKQMEGRPWVSIIYHKSFKDHMVMSMIRGFLVNFVIVLLLVVLLTKGGLPNFMGVLTGTLSVGVITFLWGPYMGHVWYDLPWEMISGDMLDAVVAWGLCGIWLGWWLNKK
jgi:hypothetical protein